MLLFICRISGLQFHYMPQNDSKVFNASNSYWKKPVSYLFEIPTKCRIDCFLILVKLFLKIFNLEIFLMSLYLRNVIYIITKAWHSDTSEAIKTIKYHKPFLRVRQRKRMHLSCQNMKPLRLGLAWKKMKQDQVKTEIQGKMPKFYSIHLSCENLDG